MKAGKYCFKELFVNRYVQRIIVPEIQRDYVWGKTQVNGLLNSLLNDYNNYLNGVVPIIETDNEIDLNAFNTFYKKRKYASNIGFIYAYNDTSFTGNYFLIDGQQRVTTLYLLLAVLANRNEKLRDSFNKNYCPNNVPKLGYKVRLIADELLNKFINHVVNNGTDVNEQVWLLDAYKNDLTGKSIVDNYAIIQTFLDNAHLENELDFFNYIEDLTEFWYFDTNISEQGEELYIYMNARGEHMQSNENIKADLLVKLDGVEIKNYYGEKWENWQDFFWKHRGNNSTADNGFNQFLTCIAGLEYYLKNDESIFYSKDKFEGKKDSSASVGIRTEDVLKVLDIQLIEEYFEAFKYLVDNSQKFIKDRAYADWVDIAINEFIDLFNNKNTTNWFADYNDNDRGTERKNMVYSWSMLNYIKSNFDFVKSHKLGLYRVLRLYYLRFHNNIRSVKNIRLEVNNLIEYGIWKEPLIDHEAIGLIQDERFKINLLTKCNPDDTKELEQLIWQIEDHKLNLDGANVGNTNITHLISRSPLEINIEYLILVKTKFYEIFPTYETKESQIKLIEVLLHYGEFYDKTSPYYYLNLKFNRWKRIIRNIGTELKESEVTPFKTFFNEFMLFEGSFNDFHAQKTSTKLLAEQATNTKDRILWYTEQLGEDMWQQGYNIAISTGNYCGLKNWNTKDLNFNDGYQYYNTKGNLKGGTPKILSELIKKNTTTNEKPN